MDRETFLEGEAARAWSREAKWEVLGPYLRRWGWEGFSYATLQDGFDYLIVEGVGYLAYDTVRHPVLAPRGIRAVFCSPICAPEAAPLLVERLLAHGRRVCLAPVSARAARALRPLGFRCVSVGEEPLVPLKTYPLEGDWRAHDLIRRAWNEVRRHGIVIREVPDLSAVDRGALDRVTRVWLRHKPIPDREIRAYARPPVFGPEPDVRTFVAWDVAGEVVGFARYDPLYREGQVFGYSANLCRCDESRFSKLSVAMHMSAARVFREEGREVLNLCLAPFLGVDRAEFRDHRFTEWFFRLSDRYGSRIYNFGGLREHRVRYKVQGETKYFASRSLFPPNEAYLAYQGARMVDGYLPMARDLLLGIGEGLVRDLRRGTRSR